MQSNKNNTQVKTKNNFDGGIEMDLRQEKNIGLEQENTKPFGIKDKIGYLCGDLGNDFSFIFASMFLMVFYTNVWGINPSLVGTLFLVSRCIDAFTDVTMGRIVDKSPTTANGKFRPWIRRMAGPVAIASFLMYQSSLAGASMTVKVVVMFTTYILWGSICYTGINIPYGSMASAITDVPEERAALSTWRSLGASFASVIIGAVVPQVIYYKDVAGNQLVDGGKFTMIAGVFSLCALAAYVICYIFTTERVKLEPSQKEENVSLAQSFKSIASNRALLAIIGAAIVLLLSQLMVQTMNNYLFASYFKDVNALSILNMIGLPLSLLLATASPILARKVGKKEFGVFGMFLASVGYGVLYFIKTTNTWVFLIIYTVATIGVAGFNMFIWANITDVIDYNEVKFGERNDGVIYGVYSFARKIGQALAGGLGGYALAFIGFKASAAEQTAEVLNGIYTFSTLFPAVCYLVVGLILLFAYPLSKKVVEENTRILAQKRANH